MTKLTPQESLNIAGGFVAAGLLIVMAFVTWALVYHELPKANESAFLVLIGILSGNIGTVVNFFFGSSVGNKRQSEALATMAETAKTAGAALPPTPGSEPPADVIPVAPGETKTVVGTDTLLP